MLLTLLMYAGIGVVSGLLAGLLGVGGGLLIVPILEFTLAQQGLSESTVMHMALGTSMGTIMFTSVSSARAHHQRQSVDWTIVRRIVLGLVLGTLVGAGLASKLSSAVLKLVFVVFLFLVATQMLGGRTPKASRKLPGPWGMMGVGGVVGIVSSLVGIGGGSLSVPFMLWHHVPVRTAIGTSAVLGLPIALGGAIGYVVTGWHAPEVPPWSLGYVYLPALLGIASVSVFVAPWGAKLAHRLPVEHLKKVFAAILYVLGARMLLRIL